MRIVTVAFLATLSVPVSFSQAQVSQQGARTVALPPGMAAAHEQEAAAWVRGDAAGVVANYAPDVLYRAAGVPDWVGRDASQRGMATHLQTYKYSAVRYEPEELIPLGEYAHETGRILVTRRAPTDTVDRSSAWRYNILWKKMTDGKWVIYRAVSNANVAARPATPPGLLPER